MTKPHSPTTGIIEGIVASRREALAGPEHVTEPRSAIAKRIAHLRRWHDRLFAAGQVHDAAEVQDMIDWMEGMDEKRQGAA